ncbi:DUF2059 domain-containing protein [Pseudochelatococcus sp. G4_1912]|uniref:DUF2059 domain-containing protein n=1 Tax=Pseudochelatococcus sp. G4_1912 TaxID=3114288 RepID=UPI0039C65FB3
MKSFSFNRFSVSGTALGLAATLSIAIGCLSLSSIAHAQQPAAPQAAAATHTQSHLAAAREVVVLSGMGRTFEGMLPTFGDQVRQNFITRPEISNDLNAVLDQLKPELEQRKNEMLDTAAKILANRINEENLVQIRTFFQSTAGQQYVATQPLVLDDLFAALNTWVGDVSGFLINRVREEMRKKGHEI